MEAGGVAQMSRKKLVDNVAVHKNSGVRICFALHFLVPAAIGRHPDYFVFVFVSRTYPGATTTWYRQLRIGPPLFPAPKIYVAVSYFWNERSTEQDGRTWEGCEYLRDDQHSAPVRLE